jgi:ELWxxDGT repeat protein
VRPAVLLLSFWFLATIFTTTCLAGATLIKDIRSGGLGANIYQLKAGTSRMFFMAVDDTDNDLDQWTSDGTASGTVKVMETDDDTTLDYSLTDAAVMNNIYFYTRKITATGKYELWRSDGTASGTYKLITLPDYIVRSAVSGNYFYFVPFSDGDNDDYGCELWRSDGTVSGTALVKDIYTGTHSANPSYLTDVNGTLYFTAIDSTHGRELWKTDGTASGTVMVAEYTNGFYDTAFRRLFNVNDILYFAIADGGSFLWKYDPGTQSSTQIKTFYTINCDQGNWAVMGDELFFPAEDEDELQGQELWKTDGTASGTTLVKDIYSGDSSAKPEDLTPVDTTLYFTAYDSDKGRELWKTDGTTAGTTRVKDITEGSYSTSFDCLTAIGSTLYFIQKMTYVNFLWHSDGTEAGTTKAEEFTNLRCPVVFNHRLYLYATEKVTTDGDFYSYALTDGALTTPELTSAISGIKLTMNWNAVENATGYTVYYAPYPYNGSGEGTADLGNVTSLDADLWAGASLYLAIQAYNSTGTSDLSNVEIVVVNNGTNPFAP